MIVGYGYIGHLVKRQLSAFGADVITLGRQDNTDWQIDLDSPHSDKSLVADQVFYFVPPQAQGNTDTRMTAFLRLLDENSPPKRMVLISTTGVYGDCQGAFVDEQTSAAPTVDRALRRYDAEQQLLAYGDQMGTEVVILRVAGIYGPGRLPVKRLQAGTPMIEESAAPWTNRIHALDLVSVCLAAMDKGKSQEIYNVSDGNPGNMADYFNQVADALGLPRPPVISRREAEQKLSAGMLSYLNESRRISSQKMLDELGVVLKYPTLEQGLLASI